MDVEHAGAARARVAETVPDTGRSGHVAAGPGADGLVSDRELDLTLEDEEGVDLVGMDVRGDGTEFWVARELDHLELGALGLDDEVAVLARNRFAFAGA